MMGSLKMAKEGKINLELYGIAPTIQPLLCFYFDNEQNEGKGKLEYHHRSSIQFIGFNIRYIVRLRISILDKECKNYSRIRVI